MKLRFYTLTWMPHPFPSFGKGWDESPFTVVILSGATEGSAAEGPAIRSYHNTATREASAFSLLLFLWNASSCDRLP